ncbi:hypothetical protein [Desulfosporosinus sp. I2]|uniref:hypothetical protein n=1 Tax=Desulfosporosinus sp. I2 TaxID=1617025 RepID=UPI001A9A5012|nr:hypothetical protein [Desulfosporosinus sp. I2]
MQQILRLSVKTSTATKTITGAWLHAKSLNTDRAWKAYETLVDDYYRVMDEIKGVAKVQSLTWDKVVYLMLVFNFKLNESQRITKWRIPLTWTNS